MKLTGKNILIISPEPWHHIFVSKHHYAQFLALSGNRVVFANPPGNSWRLELLEKEGLTILDYPRFILGLRKLPAFISRCLILRRFKQIEKVCQIRFDIVWSFDNSVFFDFTLLPAFCLHHIVDYNMNFEIAKSASTADICLFVSEPIGRRLMKYNSNSYFINHGFNSLDQNLRSKSRFLTKNSGVNIGYAGNLDIKYIDWDTIQKAVEQLPNCQFYFAGSSKKNKEVFSNSNVHLVGVLDQVNLQQFYKEMDVLIICYDSNQYKDQLANPHKMMEYLGSGKPIVSSFSETYAENLDIQMSSSKEEWLPLLKSTIENLDHWNSKKLQRRRQKVALDNTYPTQIQRIEKLIHHDE
ncbi:hypothetical protein [Marinoscillum sp.]|uniref:hypothetical protein n=1 Tax=Marinoscillum sp. TaxID=2024838 RepID=UPI003BAA147D